MLRRIFLAVFLLFGLVSAALAERRVALVLAAENYRHLRPLTNPVNDARAVEDLLKSLGFEVWTETDRDLRRMRRALEDFQADGAGADLALVFYAGHGVAIDGVNYLLPVDAEAKSAAGLKETSLPLSEVQEVLAAISPNAIFLLDACRDDPFAGSGAASPDGRGAVALEGDSAEAPKPVPGLGRIGRADGALFAFAAAPGETASDGNGRNSPFTEALLRHFGTKGAELRSALTLVQQDVYDRSRGGQLPYIESGLPKLLYLSGEGELPERDRLLMAMAELPPDLRSEVEKIAAQNDLPLAPLYRAVVTGDLAKLSPDERQLKLEEAARAFTAFESDMRKFASDDPRVAELRARAEEQFALGASEAGRALMAEAADIDAKAGAALRDNLVARTLSEASTHVLNANAARASLRYDLAIEDLTKATELYNRIRSDLPDRETKAAYSLALSDLGALYQVAGNSFGALSIWLSLVDYLETLASAEPQDIGWQRELIWALKSAGDVMVLQGHLGEADEIYLRAYERTGIMIRTWPDDSDLLREREVILNSRGATRFLLSDYKGALAAHSEALEIAMGFLDRDPDNITWARDVSFTQEKMGDTLSALGYYARAREAFDVSLSITADLAERFPGNVEYQTDLAVGYERLGDMLMGEADNDSALAVFTEAQKIRDAQLERDPGNTLLRRSAAITWSRIGDVYQAMGDAGTALMSWQYALDLRRELAELDPQNAVWLRDLSISYERIGDLSLREGAFEEAIAAMNEALALREAVVAISPESLPPQRDLTISLERLADAWMKQGDLATAREYLEKSLELRRVVVEKAPGIPIYQRDLAYTLVSLGDLIWRGGDPAASQPVFDEARSIHEAMIANAGGLRAGPETAAASGINAASLAEMSVSLNNQIRALLALGDHGKAIELGRRSVELMDRAAELQPGDPGILSDRMTAAQTLGAALEASGDLAGALIAYREMAGYGAEASSRDPWNVDSARDYALALELAAAVVLKQQDYPGARRDFEAALALRKWVAGQEPDSITDLRALGYTLQNLADTYYFAGEYETGRPIEEQSLAIMRWIAGAQPENVLNRIDLAGGLYRASFYYRDGSLFLTEALALLENLEKDGEMPEGPYRDWIVTYRERLELVRQNATPVEGGRPDDGAAPAP